MESQFSGKAFSRLLAHHGLRTLFKTTNTPTRLGESGKISVCTRSQLFMGPEWGSALAAVKGTKSAIVASRRKNGNWEIWIIFNVWVGKSTH